MPRACPVEVHVGRYTGPRPPILPINPQAYLVTKMYLGSCTGPFTISAVAVGVCVYSPSIRGYPGSTLTFVRASFGGSVSVNWTHYSSSDCTGPAQARFVGSCSASCGTGCGFAAAAARGAVGAGSAAEAGNFFTYAVTTAAPVLPTAGYSIK